MEYYCGLHFDCFTTFYVTFHISSYADVTDL